MDNPEIQRDPSRKSTRLISVDFRNVIDRIASRYSTTVMSKEKGLTPIFGFVDAAQTRYSGFYCKNGRSARSFANKANKSARTRKVYSNKEELLFIPTTHRGRPAVVFKSSYKAKIIELDKNHHPGENTYSEVERTQRASSDISASESTFPDALALMIMRYNTTILRGKHTTQFIFSVLDKDEAKIRYNGFYCKDARSARSFAKKANKSARTRKVYSNKEEPLFIATTSAGRPAVIFDKRNRFKIIELNRLHNLKEDALLEKEEVDDIDQGVLDKMDRIKVIQNLIERYVNEDRSEKVGKEKPLKRKSPDIVLKANGGQYYFPLVSKKNVITFCKQANKSYFTRLGSKKSIFEPSATGNFVCFSKYDVDEIKKLAIKHMEAPKVKHWFDPTSWKQPSGILEDTKPPSKEKTKKRKDPTTTQDNGFPSDSLCSSTQGSPSGSRSDLREATGSNGLPLDSLCNSTDEYSSSSSSSNSNLVSRKNGRGTGKLRHGNKKLPLTPKSTVPTFPAVQNPYLYPSLQPQPQNFLNMGSINPDMGFINPAQPPKFPNMGSITLSSTLPRQVGQRQNVYAVAVAPNLREMEQDTSQKEHNALKDHKDTLLLVDIKSISKLPGGDNCFKTIFRCNDTSFYMAFRTAASSQEMRLALVAAGYATWVEEKPEFVPPVMGGGASILCFRTGVAMPDLAQTTFEAAIEKAVKMLNADKENGLLDEDGETTTSTTTHSSGNPAKSF